MFGLVLSIIILVVGAGVLAYGITTKVIAKVKDKRNPKPVSSRYSYVFPLNRSRSVGNLPIAAGLIVLALGLLFTISSGIMVASVKYKTFTVTDKAVASTSDSSGNTGHEYQIFTNHGVYKDADSFAFLKFNSSDVYGQLQKGHTYRCKVSGFRIPILSAKDNILSCKEVAK